MYLKHSKTLFAENLKTLAKFLNKIYFSTVYVFSEAQSYFDENQFLTEQSEKAYLHK